MLKISTNLEIQLIFHYIDDKILILNDLEINLITELTNHAEDAFSIVQEVLVKKIRSFHPILE